jgi:hypothetical protein
MRFEYLSDHAERKATYSNLLIEGVGAKSYTHPRFVMAPLLWKYATREGIETFGKVRMR